MPSQVLEAGPAGCASVAASRAAAMGGRQRPGWPADPAPRANAAFPAFRLPDDWDVVVQDSGGILLAEAAMRALREGAPAGSSPEAALLTPTAAGLRITTATQEIMAAQAIVAAGPWAGEFVPALTPHLVVTRQTVGWFRPADPASVAYGDFPVFLLEGSARLHLWVPGLRGAWREGGAARSRPAGQARRLGPAGD